ncbi:MAG: hypothetical protein QHJ73_14870 [Armatimonadota bacterium]|nr:hypothetical protein [Armatimonadota bacterium]
MVYRTASQSFVSWPVTLTRGRATHLEVGLLPTDPFGNIIENPDGRLSYLEEGMPDRWRSRKTLAGTVWSSAAARVDPGVTYRCGAVLKDPAAKVRFQFHGAPGKKDVVPANVDLPAGETNPAEATFTAAAGHWGVTVTVETVRRLTDAIDRVWVVPVEEKK